MGLYKRGLVWWMTFTYQGRQIRSSTEATDRKLAERIYHKILGQIAEGKWFEQAPGEEKTVRELLERYLQEHSARNKTPSSYRSDQCAQAHLVKAFGGHTLVALRPSLISDYKVKRRVAGAAAKTINNELAVLSHAFTLASKEWEWVNTNPVKLVSRERVHNLIERWLRPDEEVTLLAASPVWLQEIIRFAVSTGLRQSEILNLQWARVDLFRRTMTILEQKNHGRDTLPLNAGALEVLKARARVRALRSDHVFVSGAGTRIDARNLLRAFYVARKEAGLENLRFHDLRHTFASRLVQAGVDLYTVQKLGRWKTVQMVMRYAHHYPESLRAGIEALDRPQQSAVITNLSQSNENGLPEGSPQSAETC